MNYYLFRINRSLTPDCICGAGCETVAHYLLKCPRYAALRSILLSAAAQVYGDSWCRLSDMKKVNILMFGSSNLELKDNTVIFEYVQQYIRESKRFL